MGVTQVAWDDPPERGTRPSAPTMHSPQEGRLRVLTYNLGGVTSELYDSILEWLVHENPADVIILQETHWGLGRSDGAWTAAGWRVIVSADPHNRYSGVAVLLHPKLHARAEVTHVVWRPGRLLHVRCRRAHITVDILAVYQWVWQTTKSNEIRAKRHGLWTALGTLLQKIPQQPRARPGTLLASAFLSRLLD